MYISELEIYNISECKHAILKFPPNSQKSPLYLVHSSEKCEIISLALQLICGSKYCRASALHEIRHKISNGKVRLTFTLLKTTPEQPTAESSQLQDHSSDSDVPCTSRQARQRLERRLERRRQSERQQSCLVINACRDFTLNPDLIVYSIDGGPPLECSVLVFQIRFFTCTELIFPRLMEVSHGQYCNGRWLDLLSMEFVDKGREGNKLLKKFSKLYAKGNVYPNDLLCQLTSSVLTARNYLNNSRLSHLLNIFNDIRWVFEYITCSEYSVWFLLPSRFGNLKDIREITTENINFDLMKTEIQLKSASAKAVPWLETEKHVQELFLVAVQVAFGYHCQQNIIYLHSLNYLERHQSFEFLNYSLLQSAGGRQLFAEKNYFERIFNICDKLNICCVLEYAGSLPFYPSQCFVIYSNWLNNSQEWQIYVKDLSANQDSSSTRVEKFLQQLNDTIK
ncbi:protein ORD [Lucilia sericata]|uniref:protein ORD n=1 Tax=Lucilia sericata TaxID=13632 RepID=UPI0018A81D9B|nr:protein ORD [Lucilia sericata]